MQNIWKKNAKLMLILLLDVFIISGATYAATTMYQSNTVGYDNTTSGLRSTNVQDALDEVYGAATDYTSLAARVSALETIVPDDIYPVGSIYIGVTNTNPGTLFGGTWVSFGEGRTLIGVGTGTDSNSTSKTFAINETAGEYNHTLTIDEMPSHRHNTFVTAQDGTSLRWGVKLVEDSKANWSTGYSSYVGGNAAHNNLQPYITVYMWKRTA